MPKEPKIIFHHIPKCGGTSIVTGLVLGYYPLRLFTKGKKGFNARLNAPQASREAEEKGINRFSYRRQLLNHHVANQTCPFISGHYPFDHDLYEREKDNWHFVTLLRDPLERWYSEYYWNRYKDHDYRKTDLSIEEYLSAEEGQENTRSFVNYFTMTERITELVTEEEKQEALSALSKFSVVGFLDRLDVFKADLKQVFGRKPFFLQRNRSPVSRVDKEIPDKGSEFEKKLLEYLEADIEIYKKARENAAL